MGWINKLLGWMFPATTSVYASVANPAFNDPTTPERTIKRADDPLGLNTGKGTIQNIWDDLTGQSQIEEQARANMALAKYQAQMNEEFYNKYSSPEALMRQYAAAGLNPNLIYSGAGSGQGNVPSFNAPEAIRNMSPFEKLGTAISIYNNLLNLKNTMYNSVAQREVAEQSQIKTRSLLADLVKKDRDNLVNGLAVGYTPSLNILPFFKRSSLTRRRGEVYGAYNSGVFPALEAYSGAVRSIMMNKAQSAYGKNLYEYGGAFRDYEFDSMKDFIPSYIPNAFWRNNVLQYDAEQRGFNLDWDRSFKTMMQSLGIAGKLGASILHYLK